MKKKTPGTGRTALFAAACVFAACAFGQNATDYDELPNPIATDAKAWSAIKSITAGWGDTDTRYRKELPAGHTAKSISLTAWRGEKVSAQIAVSSPRRLSALTFEAGDLTCSGSTIGKANMKTAFVRYVLADELQKDGQPTCNGRDQKEFSHFLVADPIDHLTRSLDMEQNTTRCGWVSISVPRDAKAGTYRGSVEVKADGRTIASLHLSLKVKDRTLPPAKDWKFHLDLWQNPYAVARYYNVEPFSDEHFRLMRPIMQLYAEAGGKVITVPMVHRPWNGQTYDAFPSMITWMKKADGTWAFDYTVFDRWVEFMMSMGVRKQISCYSMIPWKLSFSYLDQGTNSFKTIDARPGDKAYEQLWTEMLRSFAAHLKKKGWFGITHIAMDERQLKDMLATLEVIRKADNGFKVALAGSYHKELEHELDDYCVIINENFPAKSIARRREAGMNTTFYTCCTPPRPNTFIQSPPAESEWLAWHSAKEGLDGYLRWAFNSWTASPLTDACFTAWPAGDPFLVYPDGRSSIRFERMTEGIQQYEKVRLLKEEARSKGNKSMLKKIENILSAFDEKQLDQTTATEAVNRAKAAINRL